MSEEATPSPRAPAGRGSRAWRAVDRALAAVAIGLAFSLLVTAVHDVSQAYDVWYYHLPFAGRLAGVVDASAYAFSAENRVRFEGFPLLGELLQGIVWRLTGRVAATNLVALGALFALPVFLRRLFAVPLHLALLALLAVPLVQIHATSSYVDLPANACVTMLLLCIHRAVVAGTAPSPRFLAGAALLAAAAANMKFQLVPIVAVAGLALAVIALRSREPGRLRRALVLAVALPLVLATPIKNAVAHGNPVWPVELRVLGHAFPHVESAYASSPRHLATAPGPWRFARSVLEIDNRPIASQARWSLDQWTPPDEPGYRMGGFFGAYVALNLAALGWAAWRRRSRPAIVAAALFGAVSVVASVVPQAHELRYYMHWMLLLVSLNLVLWAREAKAIVGLAAIAALAVVAWSTSGGYLYASGRSFEDFIAERVDRAVIEGAAPGERLCLSRQPFTILYAPTFHAKRSYGVQEATTDADCSGARRVP